MLKFFREINRLMDKPRCKMTYGEYCYVRYALPLLCIMTVSIIGIVVIIVTELKSIL